MIEDAQKLFDYLPLEYKIKLRMSMFHSYGMLFLLIMKKKNINLHILPIICFLCV